ncbi:MAG TPA: HNH endonuclease [Polyangiaceae bacterium]|nr:HNH endonuclease [Polyangiaceae bacterium]
MSEWRIAHMTLSRLARERAAADAAEGHWLLRARRAQAHVHLGFGSFVSYVEQLFGYTPRSISEKLRVAEALEQLPACRAALEQGQLGWAALRELTRVAVRETEEAWLQAARGKTVRQIEQLVAGKHPGDPPCAVPDPRALRYVLRFEVTAETYALFREALLELRRRSSSCFADDAALLEMARAILGGHSGSAGGPRDEGRSSYQIALSVCPECRSGRQPANGQLIRLPPEIVAMAECDAQRLPALDGNASHQSCAAAGAPASSGAHEQRLAPEARAAAGAPVGHAGNEHHAEPEARAGAGAPVGHAGNEDHAEPEARAAAGAPVGHAGNEHHAAPEKYAASGAHERSVSGEELSASESRTPAGAPVGNAGRSRASARAKQDIPPALRRAVLRRDERRCRVPGCRNATFLDLHHIVPRSEGGSHSADNLVTVCAAHHRALHRGELRSTGDASCFRVLPGVTVDGGGLHPPPASSAEVSAKVASGLCQLGFRAAEVRAVVAELRQQRELAGAAPQQWLREALRRLHRASRRAP